MLSKARISFVSSLSQAKQRREHGLFIAEGPKLVAEFLKGPVEVVDIFATKQWIDANIAVQKKHPVTLISDIELSKLSNLVTPNEVVAVCRIPVYPEITPETLHGCLLALDGIRDPGNLGSILRTADWFGISRVLLSVDSVDAYNPKVVQASMGALNRVIIQELDLKGFLNSVKGELPILGTSMSGRDVYQYVFPSTFILVIGSESHGMRPEIIHLLDDVLTIMPDQASVSESLNASVAAAVICSEWARRNRLPGM